MTKHGEEHGGGERIHTVQAQRDLEANWDVDLSVKLDEYLLKICSGEITGNSEEDHGFVNFVEAALLLQGSVQVYSKKVEYLHNLVLRTLEFLSKQRQQEQSEDTDQPQESCSNQNSEEAKDDFWNLDDIPVDAKSCLDDSTSKDSLPSHFVKPPANLVVLEGDCLDTNGDGGELESYLLASTHLFRDFILLDPCDAVAVNNFFGDDYGGEGKNSSYRGSRARKSFQSPGGRSGGSARKSSVGKNQDANINLSPILGSHPDVNNFNLGPDPVPGCSEDGPYEFNMDAGHAEAMDLDGPGSDDDEEDDPWKPLNPHEPGNLKVKPFKRVKAFRKRGTNDDLVATLFPPAKIRGTISPDLTEFWEKRQKAEEKVRESQDVPYYEKLRQSLVNGENQTCDPYGKPANVNEDPGDDDGNEGGFNDFEHHDGDAFDMFMDEDVPNKNDDGAAKFPDDITFEDGELHSQANLEDLCRSHLDNLLASIAENEKQTELAARVSSWKQKIEQNLEEQDSRPPFDIHDHGERILSKLTGEADSGDAVSFANLMKGQEKHDVARSFSALLQLVNNGDVDLDKNGNRNESFCYTAEKPFHVRLLRNDNRNEKGLNRLTKKGPNSPAKTGSPKPSVDESARKSNRKRSLNQAVKLPVKLAKINNGAKCIPDGKKRRRRSSRVVDPVDLNI